MSLHSLVGLSLLVVEDDRLLGRQIAAHLERLQMDVTVVGLLAEARRLLGELGFDLLLLDIHLPDGSGLELLRERGPGPSVPVVVMTADGGVSGAVEAMRLGAADYLVKPFDLAELPLVIERVRRGRVQARLEEHRHADAFSAADGFFFGSSLAGLERVLGKILEADQRMVEHLPPVLIQGETGTGKTTIARWLHDRGPRRRQPLVELNCSALPETLAESELFGHERGAFTDARTARLGLFEAADGGTLFLDELPSLSLPLQAKVLKVLEDHRIRRLGGRREIPIDVRVVAATSRDLKAMVARGEFRDDLMHRLDLYRVVLPPLRERGGDLPALAELILTRLCRKHRLPSRPLGELGRRRLLQHTWPGNVRELEHELERAVVFEETDPLELRHLAGDADGETPGADSSAPPWLTPGFVFPEHGFNLEEAINTLLQRALVQTGQNVSAAARLLGVSRDYVRYRLADRGKTEGGKPPPSTGSDGA